MKTRTRFTIAFIAAFTLLPIPAAALSVSEFDSKTRDQQTEFLVKAVDKIVADVARVNPALSRAIHDYFDVTPPGKNGPPGMIAFAGELGAVEDLADKGKMDLKKVQIEGILLDIVKTDVVAKQKPKPDAPAAPAQK